MCQTNADLLEMIHECDERRHFVHSLPPVAPEFEHIMHTIENYQNMGKFDFLRVNLISRFFITSDFAY
jgi:hypothetical protein